MTAHCCLFAWPTSSCNPQPFLEVGIFLPSTHWHLIFDLGAGVFKRLLFFPLKSKKRAKYFLSSFAGGGPWILRSLQIVLHDNLKFKLCHYLFHILKTFILYNLFFNTIAIYILKKGTFLILHIMNINKFDNSYKFVFKQHKEKWN